MVQIATGQLCVVQLLLQIKNEDVRIPSLSLIHYV